jgi:hypothetical protein
MIMGCPHLPAAMARAGLLPTPFHYTPRMGWDTNNGHHTDGPPYAGPRACAMGCEAVREYIGTLCCGAGAVRNPEPPCAATPAPPLPAPYAELDAGAYDDDP